MVTIPITFVDSFDFASFCCWFDWNSSDSMPKYKNRDRKRVSITVFCMFREIVAGKIELTSPTEGDLFFLKLTY